MLNSISWQQYGVAVILITAVWYAYIGLRYYRPELAGLLNIRPAIKQQLPPVAGRSAEVIGAIKRDPDTDVIDPAELVFTDHHSDGISDITQPKGPTDDLLDAAVSLTQAYRDNDDQAGFLAMLNLLIDQYEPLSDEIDLPFVIAEIRSIAQTQLPFGIDDTEWPKSFNS